VTRAGRNRGGEDQGRDERPGGRIADGTRLEDVASPIEETFWTARQWSQRTRMPYRSVLRAVSRGELEAVRPSGGANGVILISESAWQRWLGEVGMKRRVGARVEPSPAKDRSRSLSDLALS
jgi:hypothetical protein